MALELEELVAVSLVQQKIVVGLTMVNSLPNVLSVDAIESELVNVAKNVVKIRFINSFSFERLKFIKLCKYL